MMKEWTGATMTAMSDWIGGARIDAMMKEFADLLC